MHTPQCQSRGRRRRRTFAAAVAVLALGLAAPASQADEVEDMTRMLGVMSGFMEVMDAMYEAAKNPGHAALLQMNTLEDVYKARGEHGEVVEVYRQVLAKATNPTVRRLAYMRLADALEETGRSEEAIAVLKQGIEESVAAANAGK